ncbi:MAG: ParB/RepB/Spo0J family partition protein [Pirellulales bacterium]|nr:ParB/RepB/Spo0J family partition protein [Pirellulales bacterium]
MASTRSTLQEISANLNESMGIRTVDHRPQLSPVPSPKDIGRKPLRSFGQIPVDLLTPDPKQPRKEITPESLDRLARSLQDTKQLFPIRVRWSEDQQQWMIVSGERRWRAAKAAGLATVDCFFHDGELSESEILEQQLVENLLREDLQPIEQARAFSSLMELNDWNGRQLAEALHITPSTVSRALALLDLPQDVQQRVHNGELSARTAYEVSKLPDENARRKLASQAANGGMTHTQAASAVRKRRGKPKNQPQTKTLSFRAENGWEVLVKGPQEGTYHHLEEALEQALDEVRLRIKSNIRY